MSRLVLLSLALVGVDQLSKALAQLTLEGHELLLAPDWGLTYVVNPGLWLWPTASSDVLLVLTGIGAAFFGLMVLASRLYTRWYRPSPFIDLAVAFLAVAAFGNLLDRLQVGGARDWLVTPIATGNFADMAVVGTIAFVVAELVAFPPARRLLSIDPRRWRPGDPPAIAPDRAHRAAAR